LVRPLLPALRLPLAPTLSLKEFRHYRQDLIVGASIQVSVPSGQYDESRLVNIGTNRRFVKPELGLSKPLGPLSLEHSAAATVFPSPADGLPGLSRALRR
jgi:hypothetical protein